MDEYSSRRASGGLIISRKAPSLVLRESAENNNRERNAPVCSRAGCSSKLNSMKAAETGSPSKAKTSRNPSHSSGHGKEIIGTSSRTHVGVNSPRKSSSDPKKKLPSRVEIDSETSILLEESGNSETTSSEGGSSSSGTTSRLVKRNSQRFQSGSSSSASFASKQFNQGARNGASTSRYNLRNLRCNSISDVVPSGCSSPTESSLGRRRDIGRKRIGEPESSFSSARGKKINGPMMDDRRDEGSNRGISISDSRRGRNSSPSRDSETAFFRTRRSTMRTQVPNQETPSSPQPDISADVAGLSSENQFSMQNSSNRAGSFSRPGSNSDHTRPNRSIGPYEVGVGRSFVNRDALRQYNLDGIAEMLLALERIEQEEEPSYEQLLVLETNLFLGGLAFHDQHRDMRLDIDNMSYEELLALEERMGTVSTALPEEDLAKCLTRIIYQGTAGYRKDEDEDDVKCCICQEEYEDGDEIGRLSCDHRYHVECIHQWLRLKNWCPICKVSAAPSPSAPPP